MPEAPERHRDRGFSAFWGGIVNPVAVALLVPLAGLLLALAHLIGGRTAQVMTVVSAVLFGLAVAFG